MRLWSWRRSTPTPVPDVAPPHYASITDVGRSRTSNQDEAAAAELPDGSLLLLVADGVGGAPGGEVASAAT
ncbi:MAG: protein phosphatase 2C domain-containing protein, partial [Tepidiformaceae bacterium]